MVRSPLRQSSGDENRNLAHAPNIDTDAFLCKLRLKTKIGPQHLRKFRRVARLLVGPKLLGVEPITVARWRVSDQRVGFPQRPEMLDVRRDVIESERGVDDERVELSSSAVLSWTVLSHDLEGIYEQIDSNKDLVGPKVLDALKQAMIDQIEQAGSIAEGYSDESDLGDQIKAIHRFAELLGIAKDRVARAVSAVQDQIGKISEKEAEPARPPSYSSAPTSEPESFNDSDLANLFAPLIHGFK